MVPCWPASQTSAVRLSTHLAVCLSMSLSVILSSTLLHSPFSHIVNPACGWTIQHHAKVKDVGSCKTWTTDSQRPLQPVWHPTNGLVVQVPFPAWEVSDMHFISGRWPMLYLNYHDQKWRHRRAWFEMTKEGLNIRYDVKEILFWSSESIKPSSWFLTNTVKHTPFGINSLSNFPFAISFKWFLSPVFYDPCITFWICQKECWTNLTVDSWILHIDIFWWPLLAVCATNLTFHWQIIWSLSFSARDTFQLIVKWPLAHQFFIRLVRIISLLGQHWFLPWGNKLFPAFS